MPRGAMMTEAGEMRKPTREGVLRAASKIAEILPPTPLLPVEIGGTTTWCKAECLQPIGVFKIRGAWHRLSDLTEEERARGVVGVSSGNHAQGVAWAARRLGMDATIVMPEDAPRVKLGRVRELGADVVTYDRMRENREEIAQSLAAERGAAYVHAFGDPWVIEGQGSAGIEIMEQMRSLAGGPPMRIITPCGGGGLAAGLALACPDVEIVAVEPEGWDDVTRSLLDVEIRSVDPSPPPTSCDALQTFATHPINFDVLRACGVRGVAVSEKEIAAAMRFALENLRLVLEPGGAAALAAALAGKADVVERTAIILTGGNVDRARYAAMVGSG